jgi:hypothetical protein
MTLRRHLSAAGARENGDRPIAAIASYCRLGEVNCLA